MSDEDAEEVVARAHQARGRGAVPRPTQRTAPLSERGSRSENAQAPRALRQSRAQVNRLPGSLRNRNAGGMCITNCQQLCNRCTCQRRLQQQNGLSNVAMNTALQRLRTPQSAAPQTTWHRLIASTVCSSMEVGRWRSVSKGRTDVWHRSLHSRQASAKADPEHHASRADQSLASSRHPSDRR